jgi:cytochrome c oxidase subunit 3
MGFLLALSAFFLAISLVAFLRGLDVLCFIVSFGMFVLFIVVWGLVSIFEFGGGNDTELRKGIVRLAFFFFILSEVMFFSSFFWAFFTFSLIPTPEIGASWPPVGIYPIQRFGAPFWNTVILLSSGVRVTWAHHRVKIQRRGIVPMLITICLGVIFVLVQKGEYMSSKFCISDRSFGASFFILTGFHGFHVVLGLVLLVGCLLRSPSFTSCRHVGLECSIWY